MYDTMLTVAFIYKHLHIYSGTPHPNQLLAHAYLCMCVEAPWKVLPNATVIILAARMGGGLTQGNLTS